MFTLTTRCLTILLGLHLTACAPAYRGTEEIDRNVHFVFFAPAATSVSIAGSFNRWEPAQVRLGGPDKRGVWTITLPLSPGRYEYRFIINGNEWVLDPSAPTVDDELGGRNSLVVVPP
jgi:1,4-alpha-glucan branching enzyme